MPSKKTITGFFVAIAFSGAVFAAEPPAAADESQVSAFFERYSDSLRAYTDSVKALMDRSLNFLGVPYRLGGTNPLTGFDCSGFVGKVFTDALGFGMPRTAAEMAQMGEQVNRSDLKPGDLVFFNTMRRAFSHVGIYLGNNQFVHAPSAGGVVRVEDMRIAYWAARYDGARRLLPSAQARQSQAN
ncbi:MAG TPA: C40 family peptidase [Zoogloea sp.]|uniref:C40 family peptidase n=1 Tax=Zoogloea sp. TaxID=49181 RepID=UPI002C426595|nr:C40 family peptidase [Zoogloea sp.]HMV16553.1 C40 family peptidase [Rhodocyclaceae bacterium]HMV64347.1 C40 family peptidase [Rhodocyclaceae bacterium]HMW50593.1 C40 family peptidase [Rhodocyclaceae bacterium]HMY48762.1 C40 family peptidase [Rhodocyclaceae bacterium]HMZ74981.1 C40 family peptidase [Rhodocyclaceae bacterium]